MGFVKGVLKWVGILFGIVVAVMIVAVINANTGGSIGASHPLPPKETYETSAQQLFADYEGNEVAADERMKGKTIKVSGRVQSIDKDFADKVVISFGTANQFLPVRLTLNDAEKQKAMALKKGASRSPCQHSWIASH